MAKEIEVPTTDQGSIDLFTDYETGMITITVREPLAINKSAVKVNIADFLERAAMIQIETIKVGRAQAHAFAKQVNASRS